ncbi:DNA recombination protein RmuC [Amphibiibacter pelophylacis]|uniref:DNA recombination protein RmuC n=1 Tax=Amphibiibacter pelophylacis TaxID=1799477 RepID=A0ACC6P066_9BURK
MNAIWSGPLGVLLLGGIGLVLLGAVLGAVLVALLLAPRWRAQEAARLAQAVAPLQAELAQWRERASGLQQAQDALQRRWDELAAQADAWRDGLDTARDELAAARERAARVAPLETTLDDTEAALAATNSEVAVLRRTLELERSGHAEKLAQLQQARQELGDQFRVLANQILEEKSQRFSEQNREGLGQLLDPLRQQLADFKGKVEEVYEKEGRDRFALTEQVKQLAALNQTLSSDAQNLTRALKGSSKTQGNWGELLLERVLESAGLRKGFEYTVQESHTREDGSRVQPDVVIHLPGDRHLVVDAKVSLLGYEACTSAETDTARANALRAHLDSVRSHIRGLSDKKYQTLYGLASLDCVLMFVPIEPAFMMAVTQDEALFMDAWERNVLLVSPSTLLFVVRTVAHLWRQEAQSRNAQEVARRGAEFYDKLAGFVDDLARVGERLDQAQVAWTAARSKLEQGRGNVLRQAELLKNLGVRPSKTLAWTGDTEPGEGLPELPLDSPAPPPA